MKRKRKPKKVVVKNLNLNQAFQIQIEEAKEVKKDKPRKAPLCISHGGPTKILKNASKFVEKDKVNSLINMEMLF